MISIVSKSCYGMPRGQIHINLPHDHAIMSFETIEIKMAAVSGKRSVEHLNQCFSKLLLTHHMNHEPRVLCTIFMEANRSRNSPSFSCLGKARDSSGICLRFILATLLRVSLASASRPFLRSQRTDSGVILCREVRKQNVTRRCNRNEWYHFQVKKKKRIEVAQIATLNCRTFCSFP